MLSKEWSNMENSFCELGDVTLVRHKLIKLKKRQIMIDESPIGYEEYID